MVMLGEMTLEDAAREAAGNWRRFDCFIWDRERELDDADNWAIIYTHNRDSGLLAQSNAAYIGRTLRPFTEDQSDDPDVVMESHSHWAVGHVDGASIRVYRDGEITEAFKTYYGLLEMTDGYPILDEDDYGDREYEVTAANIAEAAWRLKGRYDLPEGWAGEVYSWLSDNRPAALDNRDDRGGYQEEDDLRAAFGSLGYPRLE